MTKKTFLYKLAAATIVALGGYYLLVISGQYLQFYIAIVFVYHVYKMGEYS